MYKIRKIFVVATVMFAIVFACQMRICLSAEEIEGKVNINTATESQIALLPGIGPKLATEVISFRANNGNYKTVEDIKKVSGVGDKKFEKIKNYVAVEGDTTIKSIKTEKAGKETK